MRFLIYIFIVLSFLNSHAQKNYFPIVKKGKWGVIDSSGQIIIQPVYNYISPFKNSIAIFKKSNKYGLLKKRKK